MNNYSEKDIIVNYVVNYIEDEYGVIIDKKIQINYNEWLIIINKQLILYFRFEEKDTGLMILPYLAIYELTYNSLYNFNKSKYFRDSECFLEDKNIKNVKVYPYVMNEEQILTKRKYISESLAIKFANYEKNIPPIEYTFVIYRISKFESEEYGIKYHKGIINEENIKKDLYKYNNKFSFQFVDVASDKFYLYLEKIKRELRESLYDNLEYCFIYKKIFFHEDLLKESQKILNNICNVCKNQKFILYTNKNSNKWKQEKRIYQTIKKIYKSAIYQYRVDLYDSKRHTIIYDVFLSNYKIAIEYQGEQHFFPVDLFGGKLGFEETIKRDAFKKEYSNAHGIEIIYFNYFDNLTDEYIIKTIKDKIKEIKVKKALSNLKIKEKVDKIILNEAIIEKYYKMTLNEEKFDQIAFKNQSIQRTIVSEMILRENFFMSEIVLDDDIKNEDIIYLINNSLRSNTYFKICAPYKKYPLILYYHLLKFLNEEHCSIRKIQINMYNDFLFLDFEECEKLKNLINRSIAESKFIYQCVQEYKSKILKN